MQVDLNCEPVARNKKSMDRNKVPIRIPCREIINQRYLYSFAILDTCMTYLLFY